MAEVGPPQAPIFIVGVGRSGTSLLQSMLATHPQVAIPPETVFLRRYVATGLLSKTWAAGGEDAVAHKLGSDSHFGRTGIDPGELVGLVRAAGPVTDGAMYRAMLGQVQSRQGKPRGGDKDPRAVEFLDLISRTLDGCHIVHVIRDPRDVLASKKTAAWSREHSALRHIFANRVQLRMGRLEGARLFGARYHEVVYEKLLADPGGELERLCEGLGLRYEPAMLDFGASAERLVSEQELSWKKETLGPLLPNNRNKWNSTLSDWEVALTELACKSHFEAGGYSRSGRIRWLPWPKRLTAYGVTALIAGLDPIYRVYRMLTIRRASKFV